MTSPLQPSPLQERISVQDDGFPECLAAGHSSSNYRLVAIDSKHSFGALEKLKLFRPCASSALEEDRTPTLVGEAFTVATTTLRAPSSRIHASGPDVVTTRRFFHTKSSPCFTGYSSIYRRNVTVIIGRCLESLGTQGCRFWHEKSSVFDGCAAVETSKGDKPSRRLFNLPACCQTFSPANVPFPANSANGNASDATCKHDATNDNAAIQL